MVRDSACEITDPNPILDDGSPTSIGGMSSAIKLCEALGIPFKIRRPDKYYERGWGFQCQNSSVIACSWSITLQDISGRPTTFDFDLFRDESQLIIGLDLKAYSNTENMGMERLFKFKRPTDSEVRTFRTYMSGTSELNNRLRVELCPALDISTDQTVGVLVANVRASTLVKRFHRLTHATPEETKRFMREGGKLTEEVEREIIEVYRACELCCRSGQPAASRKISMTHVNQEFNEELQMNFTYVDIRDSKHVVLHIVDAGTAYSETAIVGDRRIATAIRAIEEIWLKRHGTPVAISADDELDATTKRDLKSFMESRHILFKPRPVRRHNKIGIAERKHGTLNRILEKLQHDRTDAEAATILSRATFMSNMFAGSHILSAFELARGFSPSVLGIPARIVTSELLQAHKDQQATRALQRLMRSRPIPDMPPNNLRVEEPVFFYYKSSKNNERDEWKSGRIHSLKQHYAIIQSEQTARKTKVAYEDIRIKPQCELTRELMKGTVECYLRGESERPRRIDGGGGSIRDKRGRNTQGFV